MAEQKVTVLIACATICGAMKKPWKRSPVIAERGSAFAAYSGCCQTHCGVFNKILSADDISAGRRKSAAGVFDKRTGHDVNAVLGRLMLTGELTVAVIDHNGDIRRNTFDGTAYLADLLCRERLAVFIAS